MTIYIRGGFCSFPDNNLQLPIDRVRFSYTLLWISTLLVASRLSCTDILFLIAFLLGALVQFHSLCCIFESTILSFRLYCWFYIRLCG